MTKPNEFDEMAHVFLAMLLESVLTPLGVEVSSEVRVMGAPPRADILLLRRQGARWNREQKARLPDGIRQYRAGHVLIEFKHDQSLVQDPLVQTLCYDHHYRKAQKIKPNELRTVRVTARPPFLTAKMISKLFF